MTDFILRIPFVFRDERLFPNEWHSFVQEIWGVNHIELEVEVISFNRIVGELTSEIISISTIISEDPTVEYISINDLSYPITDVVAIFDMEISEEIISVNRINGELTSEIVSVNDLSYPIADIAAIFDMETSEEVISVNRINGELTTEILSINDLSYPITDIVAIFDMEISEEIISVNRISDAITREYLGINILAEDFSREIISIIDIFENEIAECEVISINRLETGIVSLTRYQHTVRIYIDNAFVNDYVSNWSISISESDYVHSATVNFINKEFFAECDPARKIGEKRVKIYIDGIWYQFMLEKRSFSRDPSKGIFGIWGRSLIAILDLPYAVPIDDKEVIYNSETGEYESPDDPGYVPHIWQTGNRMASEIVENVIGSSFDLSFQIEDFVVKQGILTVSDSSPIKVVDTLARAVGAIVRTDLEDRVIVKYEEFDTDGTVVAGFIDSEDILMMDESITIPGGYNKILVRGYEDPMTETGVSLKLELDEELNEDTVYNFYENIWVRLYRYPFTLNYNISCSIGSLFSSATNRSATITKEVSGFEGGTLRTNYPIHTITNILKYDCTYLPSSSYSFEEGYDVVTSSSVSDEPVLITYTTKYDLYKLVVAKPCNPMPFTEVISKITATKSA